jgi:hypothetical protein
MLEAFLVPEKTVITAKGDGTALNVSRSGGRIFLLTLEISKIIEQESLDVSIYGSADSVSWDAKPIKAFPQTFYCEEVPLLLNLTTRPDVHFVRAHWEVNRWGRGAETPMFEFCVKLREVPQEILAEAAGRVRVQ